MKQTVTIYSEKKDKLETIKDYLKTENSADELLIFDLNNLVRMPKELMGITCMTTNEKGKMVDIYYRQEEAKDFMDFYMSKEQDKKMDVEDCVFLSKHISTFLEVEDPISSSYILEVSSGGLARPLTMIEDYISFKNNEVKIVLKEKFLGRKTYKGFLGGVDENGKILLETDEDEIKFNFLEIEEANIVPNWAIKNNQVN